MIKSLKKLYTNLQNRGFHREANFVEFLIKYAGYEDEWQERIEGLSKFNKRPFNHWFPDGDRLYLEFQSTGTVDTPFDKEVVDAIEGSGYEIIDYIGGYCQKDGRKYKIGKVLNKLMKENIKSIKDIADESRLEMAVAQAEERWKRIINTFLNSEYRTNKKYLNDLMVVISQNPHDVAKMSYERAWKSCMELGEGSMHHNVFCEVESGGLVAYLITRDDKNIEKPLARIHIRRFSNASGTNIAKPEGSVYGNTVPGFAEFVEKFIKEKNEEVRNTSDTPYEGLYSLRGGTYTDTFSRDLIVTPEKKEVLIEWFKEPPKIESIFWYFEDRFYQKLKSRQLDYWDDFKNNEIMDPRYAGYKNFETQEDAENFKRMVENYSYDWEDLILTDSQRNEYERQGALDNEIKRMKEERFIIESNSKDKTSLVKKEVARKLTNEHADKLDPELGKMLIDFAGANRLFDVESKVFQLFPDLLTKEVFEQLKQPRQNFYIHMFDNSNPEKADELRQIYTKNIVESLDLEKGSLIEKIKRQSKDFPHDSPEERAYSANYMIKDAILDIFSSKIDDELYLHLNKFLFEDIFKIEELSWAPYKTLFRQEEGGEYISDILRSILRGSEAKVMSKNSAIIFAKNMLKHVDLSLWENDYDKPNIHNWLRFARGLAGEGRVFLPAINKIMENADSDAEKNERYKRDLEAAKWSKDALRDDKDFEVRKRIRRAKHVIDCIENDAEHSQKYRWF